MVIRKGLILAVMGTTIAASGVLGAQQVHADPSLEGATVCTASNVLYPTSGCIFYTSLYTIDLHGQPMPPLVMYTHAEVSFSGFGVVDLVPHNDLSNTCESGVTQQLAPGNYTVQVQPSCLYTVTFVGNSWGAITAQDVS